MDGGIIIECLAAIVRELALFAAVGFLLLGASDLAVDLIWISLKLKRRFVGTTSAGVPGAYRRQDCRLAIFVPAWQEEAVIGRMLARALDVWDGAEFRIFVGCYPNDPATIAAVQRVSDPRVHLVIGPQPGPTTKAANLNALWRTLGAVDPGGQRFQAVVLHDAEDVVHSAELKLFAGMIDRFDLIQLPVLPLPDRSSRWTAGSYLDEFAENHGKEMVVREALDAGVPSAGVGCAVSREALELLAGPDNAPFDAASVTEDYEMGLKLHALGRTTAFVRLPSGDSGGVVATREHFPADWRSAVKQKSRWIAGIALSGWDRLGWGNSLAERWMRLRDRQALLAALLLVIAYTTMIALPLVAFAADWIGHPVVLITPALATLMMIATGLLVWRLIMRFSFVAASYGLVEGLRSVPRIVVSNVIAMLAAREALARYGRARRSGTSEWGKTAHVFPDRIPAE